MRSSRCSARRKSGGDRAAWLTDLGNALVEDQRFDDALVVYDRALSLAPTDIVATSNRALALRGLRRHQEAAAACEAALAISAEHVDSMSNLGIIYKEMRNFEAARAIFDRALVVAPGHATIRINLAVLLVEMGRGDEAALIADALLQEHPELVEPWNVMHYCLFERGDLARAAECTREALQRDPRNRNANWNAAVHDTAARQSRRWVPQIRSAASRLVSVVFNTRRYAVPEWDGSPLSGRSIFVHAEQGLGDSIQFVRYAKLLKARGAGRVIVECSPTAAALLATVEGIDELVLPGTPLPPFDVHAYLMSLPLLLGTTLENIPASVPYIAAPDRDVARFVRESGSGLRVGLAWAGNPSHQRDLMRSISLAMLAPVLGTEGVTFFSLQKGPAAQQLTTLQGANIIDLDRQAQRSRGHRGRDLGTRSRDCGGHGRRASRRRAWKTGVGAAAERPRLALDARARGFAVVSDDATVPPAGGEGMDAGDRDESRANSPCSCRRKLPRG